MYTSDFKIHVIDPLYKTKSIVNLNKLTMLLVAGEDNTEKKRKQKSATMLLSSKKGIWEVKEKDITKT